MTISLKQADILEEQSNHKSKTYNRFTKTKKGTQVKIKGNPQTTKRKRKKKKKRKKEEITNWKTRSEMATKTYCH